MKQSMSSKTIKNNINGKTMTIEQKARAYDEAIKKARKLASDLPNWRNDRLYHIWDLESIFPELAESEDERIKDALIRFHKSTIDIDGIKGKDIVAWLEKQGQVKESSILQHESTHEGVSCKENNNSLTREGERLRKTTIAFLKDFAEQGYENAVECIDWLKSLKQRIGK